MSILIITNSFTRSADYLCDLSKKRGLNTFRFNIDLFKSYILSFDCNGFKISDPLGRHIHSSTIEAAIFYKGHLIVTDDLSNNPQMDYFWLYSTINNIVLNIILELHESKLIRLFPWYEGLWPKVHQMKKASNYFSVPQWRIYWGCVYDDGEVMIKQFSQRGYHKKTLNVTKINSADLSPDYPWFTQEPAKGNRDATVLYINGKVHCYQFATERGELTDWRVTQGTDANKWESWDAGEDFENKVRAYMQELGLKFGRLDFIIGSDEPEFLEVNPCGQFGWLDDENLTLHKEVLDAILDPSSTIEL